MHWMPFSYHAMFSSPLINLRSSYLLFLNTFILFQSITIYINLNSSVNTVPLGVGVMDLTPKMSLVRHIYE